MNRPHVLTVCGSLRSGSYNSILLGTGEAELSRLGAHVERYTAIRTIAHYDQDQDDPAPDEIAALRTAVAAADGVVIATPAYNGTITGALKDWIDWLSRPLGQSALAGKPVAIITASIGPRAGVQSAEYLERICTAFRGHVVHPTVSIAGVHATLDGHGTPDHATRALVIEPMHNLMLTIRGAEVTDNEERSRFELIVDGAVVSYSNYVPGRLGDVATVELPHTVTEVPQQGQGMASFLTRTILDRLMTPDDGRRVIPSCHFVAEYIEAHPRYQPLLVSRG